MNSNTVDSALALAMNPMYKGVIGEKPSPMLTLNEIKFSAMNKMYNSTANPETTKSSSRK